MKIKNIFKKNEKDSTTSKIQSLDKKQLEKVIGGAEGDKTQTMEEVAIKPIRVELK